MFNQVKCCNEGMSVKALLLVALLNKCEEDLVLKEKHILYFLLFPRWFWKNWSCIIVPPVDGYIYYEHSYGN